MVDHKLKKYQKVGNYCETGKFFPFVVDATGRLGTIASGFINKVFGSHPDIKANILNQISTIIQHWNGMLIHNARQKMKKILNPLGNINGRSTSVPSNNLSTFSGEDPDLLEEMRPSTPLEGESKQTSSRTGKKHHIR
jgi:hypothetical protein